MTTTGSWLSGPAIQLTRLPATSIYVLTGSGFDAEDRRRFEGIPLLVDAVCTAALAGPCPLDRSHEGLAKRQALAIGQFSHGA